jgi:hypothetical protein
MRTRQQLAHVSEVSCRLADSNITTIILFCLIHFEPAFSPHEAQVNAQLQILAREQRRADLTFQGV